MKVKFLGHACFKVWVNDSMVILMDPWFWPAHLCSWFPYPNNMPFVESESFDDVTHLYVSHPHEDHWDEIFLQKKIRKDIPILCPNFINKGMERLYKKLGYTNLILLDHKQEYHFDDDTVATLFLDTASFKNDSALLIKRNGFTFFNMNDCYLPIEEYPTDVDLLATQYSGAMHYPNAYDFSAEVTKQKVQLVLKNIMDKLIDKCDRMKVKYFLPSAGPACFLDPALVKFDDREETIFPLWEQAKIRFICPSVEVMDVNPGATFDVDYAVNKITNLVNPDILEETRFDDVLPYYALPEEFSELDLSLYFRKLCTRHGHVVDKHPKKFYLKCGDRQWLVSLTSDKTKPTLELNGSDPEANYTLTIPARAIRALLDKKIPWEGIFGSMRAVLHRDVDDYDHILFMLLNYADSPVHTIKMMQIMNPKTYITREGFTFQQFCPHAGEDLTNAPIENGIIRCPRHEWCWDLSTGKCVSGGNLPMNTKCEGK